MPADGAILVVRREAPRRDGQGDDEWTVNDGHGTLVPIVVEDLGSGIERWVPASPVNRDLAIHDAAGKRVATLHQTQQKAVTLTAPNVQSFRSTLGNADLRGTQGVPGGTTSLVLGADLPAAARYLVIAVAGSDARAHSAIAPKSAQRTFETTAYGHKSCAHVGPGPIPLGQRISVTWVDELGRRSAATTTAVTKLQ